MENNEQYWYVATPYSKYQGGLEEAFKEACKATAALISQGRKVFSPIAHTHPVAIHGGIDPLDHTIWLPAHRPLMDHACGLIVVKMPGWNTSVGVSAEIDIFRKACKPIEFMDWPPTEQEQRGKSCLADSKS